VKHQAHTRAEKPDAERRLKNSPSAPSNRREGFEPVMNTGMRYQTLIRPSWAPPSWVFGPVWTVLYTVIAVSFGIVFYKAFTKQLPWIVALPFALNLIFNLAFAPIQFWLNNNLLASLDILLVVGTLIWGLCVVWSYVPGLRWVVYVNIAYLLWGIFATCLQLIITYLNR
jgi:tryptophan-rich sensory protein